MSAHNFIDHTNQRFGSVVVKGRVPNAERPEHFGRQAAWQVACECGCGRQPCPVLHSDAAVCGAAGQCELSI